MRPIDRFISQLDRFPVPLQDAESLNRLGRDLVSLIAPAIGVGLAEDFSSRVLDRIKTNTTGALRKIGYIAAFFLGEYDDASMPLEAENWQEIKETIEDASEKIDIAALTILMNGLLSRGLL
jgi:hypothetical protein